MFAIRCPYPYCQHENKPGARFCADCGAPLHLKPCAKCGKVDDVTATVCSSCNTPFPPIKLAEYGSMDAAQASPVLVKAIPAEVEAATSTTSGRAEKASTHGAMPLIIIALFAGGVPLLWMNRGQMPTPGWQGSGGGNTGAAVNPLPQPTPPSATPPPINLPPQAASVLLPAIQSNSPAVAGPAPITTAAPAEPVTAAAPTQPIAPALAPPKARPKELPAKTEPKPGKTNKEVAASKSPRSCTDAVSALGLCEQTSGTK